MLEAGSVVNKAVIEPPIGRRVGSLELAVPVYRNVVGVASHVVAVAKVTTAHNMIGRTDLRATVLAT
jgi:hypothetical protein